MMGVNLFAWLSLVLFFLYLLECIERREGSCFWLFLNLKRKAQSKADLLLPFPFIIEHIVWQDVLAKGKLFVSFFSSCCCNIIDIDNKSINFVKCLKMSLFP